ncbi:primase-helicase family protein [Accumulibacter sp.]|uniref:primase-helicase family protein n=1 Tax=Accumulibacter sp. TaxID=2053492 RepID=UPI0026331936|nr:primase-helicase family protein [Accumulibacter sp.]
MTDHRKNESPERRDTSESTNGAYGSNEGGSPQGKFSAASSAPAIIDTASAVSFLRWLRPAGPWLLAAKHPERNGFRFKSFSLGEEAELGQWLDGLSSQNVYYHLNPTRQGLETKAAKSDVAAVSFLHVDIDPRAGENVGEERQRIISRLTQGLPKELPPPTAIISSGAGAQALWALREPILLDGSEAQAAEAERYTRWIQDVFGEADNCHNVDRILRLPGSINNPDAKKRAKGRTAAPATVVELHPERVYGLESFQQAPAQGAAAPATLRAPSAALAGVSLGEVEHLESVDALDKWNVPGWLKVLIVQGNDPDNPTKYPSRSEALFACACELVRRGVPDEVIFSVLTDESFGIAESVVEHKSPERYARRQIERAHEDAINPMLRKLNEEFAVVGNFGGKCVVVSEVADQGLGRVNLVAQSFADFKNRFLNIMVDLGTDTKGNPVTKPAGAWWLAHPNRRQYERVAFAPGQDTPPDVYNTWKGFAVNAVSGNQHLPFLDHIRDNVCSGNEEHYRYLLGWMARAVQQPGCPGEVAVVLRGKRGTGKGFLAKVFGGLFGRHYLPVTDSRHVTGNFNAHLRDCVVLFGDEALYAGDKRHESTLKSLITEETIAIERKGFDTEAARNCLHIIMASNEAWVVPAGEFERRFFVLDVGSERMQDTAYFGELNRILEAGGRENLLHFLMNYDISDFNVRAVPRTRALEEQQARSLGPIRGFIREMFRTGQLPPEWLPNEVNPGYSERMVHVKKTGEVGLHPDKLAQWIGMRLKIRPVSVEDLEKEFAKLGFRKEKVTGNKRRIMLSVSVERAREAWNAFSGAPCQWEEPVEKWLPYSVQEHPADDQGDDDDSRIEQMTSDEWEVFLALQNAALRERILALVRSATA